MTVADSGLVSLYCAARSQKDAPAHCAGLHGRASEPRRGWVDSFWIFSPLLPHLVDFPPRPVGLSEAAELGELGVWPSGPRPRTGRYLPTPISCFLPPPPVTSWPACSLSNRWLPPPAAVETGGAFRAPPRGLFGAPHDEAHYPPPGAALGVLRKANWRRWR